MSSTDAVSGRGDANERTDLEDKLGPLLDVFAPSLAGRAGSDNFAVAAGVLSLVRAGRTFLRGDRKRGLAQALGGLLLVGIALAKRRRERAGPEPSDVVDTGPDLERAVESGERETDHATGEEVVDTKSADIEESDTDAEVDSDVETGDVDQRDVAGTGTVEGEEVESDEAVGEQSAGETDEGAEQASGAIDGGVGELPAEETDEEAE